MSEENDKTIELSMDDVSVLRVLLHTIKGISPVSATELDTFDSSAIESNYDFE